MKSLITATLVLFAVFPAFAQMQRQMPQQQQQREEDHWQPDAVDVPEKKEPSIFKRPRKETPSLQLEYANRLLDEGRIGDARAAFDCLVHRWPDSEQAAEGQYKFARTLMLQADYAEAFSEFQYLIEFYPGEFPYEKVLEHQFRIANHVRNDRWGDFLFLPGFSTAESALPLYRQLARNAPNWDRTATVWLHIGMIHEQMDEYSDAIDAYEKIIYSESPESVEEQAAYQRVKCFRRIVKRSPRDEGVHRMAISAAFSFLRDYPDHRMEPEVRRILSELKQDLEDMYYRRAVFYDENTDNVEAALITYREFLENFPDSHRTAEVEARIKELSGIVEK
jgi:tetratricopeptide (TPR) repeat protein